MVNLCYRSNGRSPAELARSLLDCDRWGQPCYLINIGLFHYFEILPHIRGKTLQIPSLALCKKNVKCQGRFARSAKAGQDVDFSKWKPQLIHVEIMFMRSSDYNFPGIAVACSQFYFSGTPRNCFAVSGTERSLRFRGFRKFRLKIL